MNLPLDTSRVKGRKKESVTAALIWLKHLLSKLVGLSINQLNAWKPGFTTSSLFKKADGTRSVFNFWVTDRVWYYNKLKFFLKTL